MRTHPLIGFLVAALALAGCAVPATAPTTPAAPAASTSDAPAASPTPTPTTAQPAVDRGAVITGFRTTGSTVYEPTIAKGGFQANGVVLGSSNPSTLSQWYAEGGTPSNILTGMNPAWDDLKALAQNETAIVTYEGGKEVTWQVADTQTRAMASGDPKVAEQGTDMTDPSRLYLVLFHEAGSAWQHTTITFTTLG